MKNILNFSKLRSKVFGTLLMSVFLGVASLHASDANKYNDITLESFKIAVLPDTQYYSMMYPELFDSQTKWIAKNYKKENIRFTVHVGDIVQNALIVGEWANAVKSMSYLDLNPETPYSILSGNHDVPNWFIQDNMRHMGLSFFLKFFPADLQKMRSKTFQGNDITGFNSYHIFKDNNGQEYLVLALDWLLSDESVEWVNSVLERYPTMPTILTSHDILDVDKKGKVFLDKNGKKLWYDIISKNDQIFLTLSGHNYGAGYISEKNNFGNEVVMIIVDYQNRYKGGNGMMSTVKIDKANNLLSVDSFSPWVAAIPKWERSSRDKLKAWSLQYPFNFQERFSNLK